MSMSRRLYIRAKRCMPGGVNSPVRYYEPYPLFVRRSKGSKVWDADDKSYLDYCMGYGSLLLGHSFESVTNAVRAQLRSGNLFCMPTEKEIELAELIIEHVRCAEMVRLVNTGTEATMHAIRLARAFTRRQKIIKFEGCYHGAHDYVLAKAGSGAAAQSIPVSEGMLNEVLDNTIVVPYNSLDHLERTIEERADEVAALIMEPVIANMGLILPEQNFLAQVRKITQQHGILLIFDEVVTGFRLALGGAQEYYGIVPDLATFAKAMSNGFTLAAIAGRRDVIEHLTPIGKVYQASTFAGNPISVSAAIATIKTLVQKKSLYEELERKCNNITKELQDTITDVQLKATVVSLGSMFQIFFTNEDVKNYATAKKSDLRKYKQLFRNLLKSGIFVPPSQFETCFISYAHNQNDTERTAEAFADSLRRIK